MAERILVGYMYCWRRKMLLCETPFKKKCETLYKKFLDKMCEIEGITNKEEHYTEDNFKVLRYCLTKATVWDCGSYYSVQYENGWANYPKTDCDELVFF